MTQKTPAFRLNLFGESAIAAEEQRIVQAAVSEALADAGAIDSAVLDIFLMHVGDRVKVEDGKVIGAASTVELFKAARPALFGPPDPKRMAAKQSAAAQAEFADNLKRAKSPEDHDAATQRFLNAQKAAARTAKGPAPVLNFKRDDPADTERQVKDYSEWLRDH